MGGKRKRDRADERDEICRANRKVSFKVKTSGGVERWREWADGMGWDW